MESRISKPGVNAAAEIDLDDDANVDFAMGDAVRTALSEHKLAGDYVVAWQDGRIVRIAAEDIAVPEAQTVD